MTGETQKTSEYIVEQLLPGVRRGGMVILVDDERRENEGDLFVAAEKVTSQVSISWRLTRAG